MRAEVRHRISKVSEPVHKAEYKAIVKINYYMNMRKSPEGDMPAAFKKYEGLVRLGRPKLAENDKKAEWKTWFEARRATQVSKRTIEKAVATPRQTVNTVVDVQESTASLKPRGKYVVYTVESYNRTHHGRTYKDDKHTLQTLETRAGPMQRVVV